MLNNRLSRCMRKFACVILLIGCLLYLLLSGVMPLQALSADERAGDIRGGPETASTSEGDEKKSLDIATMVSSFLTVLTLLVAIYSIRRARYESSIRDQKEKLYLVINHIDDNDSARKSFATTLSELSQPQNFSQRQPKIIYIISDLWDLFCIVTKSFGQRLIRVSWLKPVYAFFPDTFREKSAFRILRFRPFKAYSEEISRRQEFVASAAQSLKSHNNWQDTDFRNIQLPGAQLNDVNLSRARLDGAILTQANLQRADLSYISMDYSNLDQVAGQWARLTSASLQECSFVSANFYGANLAGANLSDADLFGCKLTGANLSYAYLNGVRLSDAYLIRATLSGADLSEAICEGVNFRDSYLKNVCFRQARLRRSDFSGANLQYADLSGADLTETDLSGADLRGAEFKEADLSGAVLQGVILDTETREKLVKHMNIKSLGKNETREDGMMDAGEIMSLIPDTQCQDIEPRSDTPKSTESLVAAFKGFKMLEAEREERRSTSEQLFIFQWEYLLLPPINEAKPDPE